MEYNRITYFLKAAQTLNFTRAAEELYISRQALAKQISLLEEDLGVVLFERNTRKVRLTKNGHEAYKQLFRASMEMEKAMAVVRSLGQKENKPKVRMGFFVTIRRSIISYIIKYINESFPDIILETVAMEMFELRSALLQGKLDLCITNTLENEFWGQYGKKVIVAHPAQVVVSVTHPWAQKERITIEDMLQEEFVMLKEDYVDMEGFFENIPCLKQVWMPNSASVHLWLEQGHGFAVALRYSNQQFEDDCVGFLVPESHEKIEITCMWNKTALYVPQIVNHIADIFIKASEAGPTKNVENE